MKEKQNRNDVSMLNDQLGQEIQNINVESKEEFQGFQPKEEKEKPKKNKKGKKLSAKKVVKRILIVLVVLIVLAVGTFFALRAFGKNSLFKGNVDMTNGIDGADVKNKGDLVIYKGHKYRYNENITSVLCMGIDRESINSDKKYLKENGSGQADSIFLAALDTSSKKISLINIPRDIMADVKTYDSEGKYTGTTNEQICLSYAYGDGKKKSCTNLVDSVSKVMYGIPIDSYMSINLSSISVLNDAVGGVNVQVLGDLSSVDPALKEGASVTLLGDQAEAYVRTRDFEALDANVERMRRQKQYVTSFMQTALREFSSDVMLPVELFHLVSENAVTNLSMTKLTYLATTVSGSSFSSDNIYSIDCKIKEGKDGFAEYYPDETKLFELILKVFYKQID